jgi:plasmid stability protein
MAQLIVRRLGDEVKERLKARAKRHGRSVEAEARAILEAATKAEPEEGFGTLMSRRFEKIGLTEEEFRLFNEGIEDLRRGSKPRDPGFDR